MTIVATRYLEEGGINLSLPEGERFRLGSDRIVVWMCFGGIDCKAPPANAKIFPALIDTGCTAALTMTEAQFDKWRDPGQNIVPFETGDRLNGMLCDRLLVSAWIFRQTLQGSPDKFDSSNPKKIEIEGGLWVRRKPTPWQKILEKHLGAREIVEAAHRMKLPLLGLRAITHSRIRLNISGYHRHCMIDSSRKQLKDGVDSKELYRIETAADQAGLAETALKSAIDRQEIDAHDTGCGLPLVRLSDVRAWAKKSS